MNANLPEDVDNLNRFLGRSAFSSGFNGKATKTSFSAEDVVGGEFCDPKLNKNKQIKQNYKTTESKFNLSIKQI